MKAQPGGRVLHEYNDKEYLGTIQNISNDNIAAVSLPGEGQVVHVLNDFNYIYDGIDTLTLEVDESSDIEMDVENRTLMINTK